MIDYIKEQEERRAKHLIAEKLEKLGYKLSPIEIELTSVINLTDMYQIAIERHF